jgi:hypothetical protein
VFTAALSTERQPQQRPQHCSQSKVISNSHSGGWSNRHSNSRSENTATVTAPAAQQLPQANLSQINNGFYCRLQAKVERKIYMGG